MSSHRVVVIGSGPSGATAAIYLSRANLPPVVYEGIQPGGQLTTTTEVDNYPGFPEGITGPDLIDKMKAQAERFDAKFVWDSISSIEFEKRPFILHTENGETAEADAIIISTGATARYLGLPSEERMKGKGVSACATCDGFFYKDVHVIVVGGGDTAMEEADFLTKFASGVTIVHRRDTFRASKIMVKRIEDNPKISIVWDSEVLEVLGEAAVTGVKIRNRVSDETSVLAAEGLFLAIGHTPNTQMLDGAIDTDNAGYIKTTPGSTHTNIPGVFACGDVQDPIYRQAVSAAGSGCMAALDAERWLSAQE
jgi:thioredoxin reductase (NADPH)